MNTPYYQDEQVTLYHGDCLDVLKMLPDNSVDAVVTDPPYLLGFMGREWDTKAAHEHLDWHSAWTAHCLRVLKPGAHLLAFGGTRTWHRLACAVEDAGFEIRDSIAWLYGSGFPKSLDVSKAIDKAAGAEREQLAVAKNWGASTAADGKQAYGDYAGEWQVTAPATDAAKQWQGWGTALKPAFEPIVVARKPLSGTVAANVQAWGTGALNVDGCRVGTDEQLGRLNHTTSKFVDSANGSRDAHPRTILVDNSAGKGRWPSNVVLDGGMADELDKQSGTLASGWRNTDSAVSDGATYGWGGDRTGQHYADSGGASRFFPVFKYSAKAPGTERPTADGVAHPTVKPLDLMRWLVRLVTPPNGVVLDPFAGSGTTGEAAIHEHKRAILIEREPSYLPLIVARLSKPMAVGFDFEVGA